MISKREKFGVSMDNGEQGFQYPVSAGISGISAIDAYIRPGTIPSVKVYNDQNSEVTKMGEGGTIKFAISYDVIFPSAGWSWRITTTVCETSQSLSGAWPNLAYMNYVIDNASANAGGMAKTNQVIDMGQSANSLLFHTVMPPRALTVLVKIWVRGDLTENYPPIGESWRQAV